MNQLFKFQFKINLNLQFIIIFFSIIIVLSCGEATETTEATEVPEVEIESVEHDSTITSVDSAELEVPPLYCCSNHSNNPHCGTHNELTSLTNSYGCSGFYEMHSQ